MDKLLYYRPRLIYKNENLCHPGIAKFSHFFKIFNLDVVIIDRTEVIKTPIQTQSLFPVPTLVPTTKTYEDICNERASELLAKADSLGTRLNVLYSGGIDSTLIMVSLLKNASPVQKKNITVLLSDHSIFENPVFYKNHILGKLDVKPSGNFASILGTDAVFVTGEHNDQLFGSDMVAKLVRDFGEESIHVPYDRRFFSRFFNGLINEPTMNSFYLELFEKLCNRAPIPIKSNFEVLWWINFSLKWQAVFMRILMYTTERNISNITADYIKTRYYTFYGTDEFQLWSLNNLDKRIKNTWKSYKWVCKDIIYRYTKDAEYRDNKVKAGSLVKLMIGSGSYNFADTSLNFYNELPIEAYYNLENDFI